MTRTDSSMDSSVWPHSTEPSRVELCSKPFWDPGAACRSKITFKLYFLCTKIIECMKYYYTIFVLRFKYKLKKQTYDHILCP